ncbi:MAG: undecaprenyl/decaprenyl-phosphate alpha-N-acetylglucosaminyl 1-phosphate transferase [Saprospiraceae bacterium]|nr:undecaprenyl/decaprenyl-phosphate alpha-N-acetylglucosaminyl 1-phosphate transferase [Saprospiraceae bacterium]
MYAIILGFLTAFTLTYFAIPSIIGIAKEKHLFDEPNARSSHKVKTPSLGGIAIFAGTIFSIVLWTPFEQFGSLQYILCAFLIIFLIGAKDDISPMSPFNKMIGQVLAASILVFKSGIQFSSMYGIFGVHDQPGNAFFILLSIFTILVIINSFNLIDGINGLAGSVGALIAGTLGIWFFMVDKIEFAIVAFATVGAVIAFLKYNYTPAKIFMGDTGSLLIGLVCAMLIIKFIDLNYYMNDGNRFKFYAAPAVAFGVMILPLFDTLRVFITRIFRGYSPFTPDRRHIHHLLIDYGLTHMQATTLLVLVNIFFIVLVFALHQQMELHLLLFTVLGIATALTLWLHLTVTRRKLHFKA